MFGEMDNEERDEMMELFRRGVVKTFITTNMLARGIDVPEIDIVINYDVPITHKKNGQRKGDAETYIHRIGRAGRFGVKGIAITLLDRKDDQNYFDDIVEHFSMKDKVKVLDNVEQFVEAYKAMSEGDI